VYPRGGGANTSPLFFENPYAYDSKRYPKKLKPPSKKNPGYACSSRRGALDIIPK